MFHNFIAIYQFYTGTPITIPKREIPPIDPQCFRQALEELCSTASQLGRAAIALLEMWDQGVQTFSYSLLRDKTQLTIEQVPKVCYQLKERGIIKADETSNGPKLYSFTVENDSKARIGVFRGLYETDYK